MPRQSGDQHWTKRRGGGSPMMDPINWLLDMNDRAVRQVTADKDKVILQVAMGPKGQELDGTKLTLDDLAICINVGILPDRAVEIAEQILAAVAKVRSSQACPEAEDCASPKLPPTDPNEIIEFGRRFRLKAENSNRIAHIVSSPYFDVVVDGRAQRVATPMAEGAAVIGSAAARSAIRLRNDPRLGSGWNEDGTAVPAKEMSKRTAAAGLTRATGIIEETAEIPAVEQGGADGA